MKHKSSRCPSCDTRGPVWLPLPTGGARLACANPHCRSKSDGHRHLYTNVAPWPFGKKWVDTQAVA